ncbi:hypothetical protein BH10PSE19_BH10PSE19_07140 [soil metagenome]
MHISVRELKNHLSKYLHLANEGTSVTVTSHQKPLVKIVGIPQNTKYRKLLMLEGVHWNGKKPVGGKLCPVIPGNAAADYVLEDRR